MQVRYRRKEEAETKSSVWEFKNAETSTNLPVEQSSGTMQVMCRS